MRYTTNDIANWINDYCEKGEYFWAIGLIKETLKLWKESNNFLLLNSIARKFTYHYLNIKN